MLAPRPELKTHLPSHRNPRPLGLLLVLLVAAMPGLARAQQAAVRLRAAQERLEVLDFQGARALAQEALGVGDAGPEEVVRIYALLGQTLAAVGETASARRALEALLLLAPQFEYPPGTSPRVTEPLEQVRAAQAGPLQVRVDSTVGPRGAVRTVAQVSGDSRALITGVRIYTLQGGQFLARTLPGSFPLETAWQCSSSTCPYFVAFLDVHGNEVFRRGSPYAAMLVKGAAEARAPVARKLVRAGTILAGASVAAGVVTALFAFRYRDADGRLGELTERRELTRYAEAGAVDEQRRQAYAGTLVSGGVTLSTGALALFFW